MLDEPDLAHPPPADQLLYPIEVEEHLAGRDHAGRSVDSRRGRSHNGEADGDAGENLVVSLVPHDPGDPVGWSAWVVNDGAADAPDACSGDSPSVRSSSPSGTPPRTAIGAARPPGVEQLNLLI